MWNCARLHQQQWYCWIPQETSSQQDQVTFSACCFSRWSRGAGNVQSRKSLDWVNIWGTFMLWSSKGAWCAANLSTHSVFWGRGSLCNTHHALTMLPFHSSLEEASLSQGSLDQHHLRHEAQSWKVRNYSASFKCPSLNFRVVSSTALQDTGVFDFKTGVHSNAHPTPKRRTIESLDFVICI